MKLTDEDRAAIGAIQDKWREEWSGEPAAESLQALDEAIYLAGLAAGAKRERERCAKVCDDMGNGRQRWPRECSAAIRALPEEA